MMRNARVLKWAVLVLLILACYGAYRALNGPIEQTVYMVEKVNARVSLYVTQGSAGVTTGFVYQFYLVPSEVNEADFLKGIGDKYPPFLSTSYGSTQIDIRDGAIHLNVKGDVYHFNNGASYSTMIYLNAAPF